MLCSFTRQLIGLLLLTTSTQSQNCSSLPLLNATLTDWLVTPCLTPSTLIVTANATNFLLRNGITARTLLVQNDQLFTYSIRSEALGRDWVSNKPVPEALFDVNGVRVFVGGRNTSGVRATFRGNHRTGSPQAGKFAFTPGIRYSRSSMPWPPLGLRVEFDHFVPCATVRADGAGELNITIVYELYQGTAAYGRRLLLSHTCESPIFVFNMFVTMISAGGSRISTFTDASVAEAWGSSAGLDNTDYTSGHRYLPLTGDHRLDASIPQWGPGLSQFAAGEKFESFFVVELMHDNVLDTVSSNSGMYAVGLERSRMWRTVAPQIMQFPVTGTAVCSGGCDLPAGDPRTCGWCYDAAGTAGLRAYIAQAARLGFEMVIISANINSTWRSSVGPEFQSTANISWFKEIVDEAQSLGVELGVYQLLANARSGSATNQCAPGNSNSLNGSQYDDMDLQPPLGTGKPGNNNHVSCSGGPGCVSLCTANEFYDEMEASMLNFWDSTGMKAVEQDGGETVASSCSNVLHRGHHGLNDSIWLKQRRVIQTYKRYMDRNAFIVGMPGHHLEGGQAKLPGGYSELDSSIPRWTMVARMRERMIADPQLRDRLTPNAMRYFVAPFTPYHAKQAVGGVWTSVRGTTSVATLEPLEDNTLALEFVLSQSYGTGIFVFLRGQRLAAGPKSEAVVTKWTTWFKRYRTVLMTEFVTLSHGTLCWGTAETVPTSTCNIADWDGVLHRAPKGYYPEIKERGLAVAWNQMNITITRLITLPLYYAGLKAGSQINVRREEGQPFTLTLNSLHTVSFNDTILPMAVTWWVVEEGAAPTTTQSTSSTPSTSSSVSTTATVSTTQSSTGSSSETSCPSSSGTITRSTSSTPTLSLSASTTATVATPSQSRSVSPSSTATFSMGASESRNISITGNVTKTPSATPTVWARALGLILLRGVPMNTSSKVREAVVNLTSAITAAVTAIAGSNVRVRVTRVMSSGGVVLYDAATNSSELPPPIRRAAENSDTNDGITVEYEVQGASLDVLAAVTTTPASDFESFLAAKFADAFPGAIIALARPNATPTPMLTPTPVTAPADAATTGTTSNIIAVAGGAAATAVLLLIAVCTIVIKCKRSSAAKVAIHGKSMTASRNFLQTDLRVMVTNPSIPLQIVPAP